MNPVSIAPDVVNALSSPGAAQALALALGVAVSAVLPPDSVRQDVKAPPPRLPAELVAMAYRVRQTSTERRIERGEREQRLAQALDAGQLAVEQRAELEAAQRAERDYRFMLAAAEGKRAAAAARIPFASVFATIGLTFLEEVGKVDPAAQMTRPRFDGDGGQAMIGSKRLGSTRIVLKADGQQVKAEVQGEIPEELDQQMTVALARAFARLRVAPRTLDVQRLATAPPAIAAQTQAVTETLTEAESVIQAVPPTYVDVYA